MPELKKNPTLRDYQNYVVELEKERGFDFQTPVEKCLLLGEEIGELFKAVRKASNIKIDTQSNVTSISEELADIFIYLCALANRYQIDIEKAFREKEKINHQRTWE